MPTNIRQAEAQAVKPSPPETALQTTPDQNGNPSAIKINNESTEQLQAKQEILSLCEKLAGQVDTSQLRPLFTEAAFKTQCGEWILSAVNFSGIEGELDDLAELTSLKKFVRENKLDEWDLEATFADDKSMFGGKVVAEAYEKLPAETRLETALQCSTLVNALLEQFRTMDGKPQEDTAEGDQAEKTSSSEQGQAHPVGDEISPLEFFLGGKVQEIIWAENQATLRAGTQPSEITDEELQEMGFEREELTESPFPDKFLSFVQIDGKWLFDGMDTEKSHASFLEKMQKFPSLNGEITLPLIANIQLAGEAVSGKQIDLADYNGKVVLIDCWGTWCGPCVASLPKLKELHKEFHDQGFEIIGVAADDKEDLEQFLSKRPLPWEHIALEEIAEADEKAETEEDNPGDEDLNEACCEYHKQIFERVDAMFIHKREGFFRLLVDEYRATFGASDPRIADSLDMLAAVLIEEGQHNQAEAHLRESLILREIAAPQELSAVYRPASESGGSNTVASRTSNHSATGVSDPSLERTRTLLKRAVAGK